MKRFTRAYKRARNSPSIPSQSSLLYIKQQKTNKLYLAMAAQQTNNNSNTASSAGKKNAGKDNWVAAVPGGFVGSMCTVV
ncbi:hypothetical protein CANMA_003283 [Candida margitis]|uniref:uncharacterized protein n=1 Tax=Candida margitis TaxID=1775924 RepID=UPI002227D77A|nr:uncharacterized protein CANMA_003283 [Candida margitis]KAI5966037.1 hypothetical protein CANMA_003283 [Candida margitis]